jgi:phospholipid N-methyltransferase
MLAAEPADRKLVHYRKRSCRMKNRGWVSAGEFIRSPKMVGSAFPASARLVNHTLERVNWKEIRLAVEYGPGSGRFTFEILKRLNSDAQLLVIETGKAFVQHLRSHCEDPRLIIAEGSARDVTEHLEKNELCKADWVLTGLPFSTLERQEAEVIMRETAKALWPTGQLAAYQMRTAIRPLLEKHFRHLSCGYEWWNLPPCHLYWASAPCQELMALPLTGQNWKMAVQAPNR